MGYNEKVTEYINSAQEDQIETLEILRKLIHESVSSVTEEIKWGIPVFAKTKDFTYLRFSKKHITFGFYNIDKIEDLNNLLEGSGSTMKHIKIKNKTDFDEKVVSKWLKSIAV
ncbi:MAG: DUF1801 domain-containing protein [Crocinitomicaceae bacterium]|nr:DUF1801 domain-containing protein [Crocinitomicaceae bacterium]MDG1776980.1 DUF1801 domain-containing protein [Crocinitomicaceae bacterium]